MKLCGAADEDWGFSFRPCVYMFGQLWWPDWPGDAGAGLDPWAGAGLEP
jgi:hypothetical protein